MEDRWMPQSGLKTQADYEAEIDRLLDEMRRLRKVMDEDQADIHRLKVETRAILARIQAA